MKKLLVIVLVVCMFLLLYGFTEQKFSDESEKGVIERLDEWANKLSKSQITDDESLLGKRTLNNEEDYYTGSYMAESVQMTGREVIFGGGTINKRKVNCCGTINTESGEAMVRVRMNEEVAYIDPDENGYFEAELSFESGGNYIMIDYEDFTGIVELICTEGNDGYEE